MIDISAAIHNNATIQASKKLYVSRTDAGLVVCDKKLPSGKWNVVDFCVGNYRAAVASLRAQGYTVKHISI